MGLSFYFGTYSLNTRFSHFSIRKIAAAATLSMIKLTKKKYDLSPYPSHIVARIPLSLLPSEVETNQPPIINAVSRAGESFETRLSPIGLKHSSPTVITPYALMSHHGLTFTAPLLPA